MKIETIRLEKLKPYANNAKIHTPEQIDQIKASIEEFGNNDPIAIDENNVIIEGHGRYMAMKKMGVQTCEVIRLTHLTDEQKRAYIHAHNQLTLNTGLDLDILAYDLSGIETIDLGAIGFDLELPDIDIPVDFSSGHHEKKQDEYAEAFAEGMDAADDMEDSEEYSDFLEKFKPKKTTDDCYTPDNIYEAVVAWCVKTYNLGNRQIIRPFYPGGDYRSLDYPAGCVVIDNPPFSIITEICDFYADEGIDFFMFAPHLTLLGIARGTAKYIPVGNPITYENGACVSTSFVTNLGEWAIDTAPELYKAVDAANTENLEKMHANLPKYTYPNELVTATGMHRFSRYGVEFRLRRDEMSFCRGLDAQKAEGKAVFGSGFLISEKAAAEKAAAEKAAATAWPLSAREIEIIKGLGHGQ